MTPERAALCPAAVLRISDGEELDDSSDDFMLTAKEIAEDKEKDEEAQWERLCAFLAKQPPFVRRPLRLSGGGGGGGVNKTGPPKLHEANVLLFFRFVAERQRVFLSWRASAPAPWTSDPTIARGRFCNVYRFLDRESVWMCAHIITPLRSRPADMLFNILIFRTYLNWHRSMELLGLQSTETFERAAFETRLRQVGAQLGKLSSAAYNVGSFHGFASVDHGGSGCKPGRVAAMFAALAPQMAGVLAAILERRDSEFTFATVSGLQGVGPFIAYQICIDLGYWQPSVYNESRHVTVGPGAEKGLKWLFSSTGTLDGKGCINHLMQSQNRWFDQAGVDAAERQRLFGEMPRPPMPMLQQDQEEPTAPLNLMALEGCLCEGNKYLRTHTQTGYGRTKQKYSASTGADARYHADYAVMMATLASSWADTASGPSTTQLEPALTAGKQLLLPPALADSTMKLVAAPAAEDSPSSDSDPFAVPVLSAAAVAAAAEWRPPRIESKAATAGGARSVAVLSQNTASGGSRSHRNVRSVYSRAPPVNSATDETAAGDRQVTWLGQIASIETQLGTVSVGDELQVVWHANGQHYPATVLSIFRADTGGVAMSGSVFELHYKSCRGWQAWTEWLPLAEFTPARVTLGAPKRAKIKSCSGGDAKKRRKSGGAAAKKKKQKV